MSTDITGEFQFKIVRHSIVKSLEEELFNNYNTIKDFTKNIVPAHLEDMKNVIQTYSFSNNFEEQLDSFTGNIRDYIPILNTAPGQPNVFLDSLKYQLENYNLIDDDLFLSKTLGISSIADLTSLTQLPATFVEMISPNILQGTMQNIITEFPFNEFSLASNMALLDTNLITSNIKDSFQNVLNISDKLVTNFSDIADIGNINNIINELPSSMNEAFIDIKGKLDPNKMLDEFSDVMTDTIKTNIKQLTNPMKMVLANVQNQVIALVPGRGSCGCAVAPGSLGGALEGFSGVLNDAAQQALGLADKLSTNIEDFAGNISDNISSMRSSDDWNFHNSTTTKLD